MDSPVVFEITLFFASVLSAAIAALAGFGIGSLLTPLIALKVDLRLAVALVSVPHFVATALRFWRLRKSADTKILLGFGLASAAGGLTGALLNTRFSSPLLTITFGCLLIVTGLLGVTGLVQRVRLNRPLAQLTGYLSGVFGGLVGNQGGIRAGALLTFKLSPEAFVATSTATGLIVDLARMPIYFAYDSASLLQHARLIGLATAGVVLGTLFGTSLLSRIPKNTFQKTVSIFILLLGIATLYKGFQ